MFAWAVACLVFSYYIFLLGIFGLLQYQYVCIGTVTFILYSYTVLRKIKIDRTLFKSKVSLLLLTVITFQALVNLIGALGPELAFDALWYHLTIPRIWLMEQKIYAIPSGTFYYSLLPKTLDLMYVAALALSDEISAKVLHWGFGLLSVFVTYKLARLFLTKNYSLLAAALFYSNLVVGWQSITAYIDLGRTFFESLTLLAFCYFFQTKKQEWLQWTAVLLGIAITTKLLAVTSLVAIAVILIATSNSRFLAKVGLISLGIPLPWFIFNWWNTGNPVFPIFSGYDFASQASLLDIFTIWLKSADPISPIYFICFPLLLLPLFKVTQKFLVHLDKNVAGIFKMLILYCGLCLVIWWITPRTGGGRFLLPYLPAFSVVVISYISRLKDTVLKKFLIITILIISGTSIGYRLIANIKYLPVITGQQTKAEFLQRNLNHSYGENWFYLDDHSLRKIYK